jgi:DNA-directed RNA polymerase specialized sigma subunit
MNRIGELMEDIQRELLREELTFEEIARMFDVPVSWVREASEQYMRDSNERFDDSMDGDAASALASVGWGVDEDYVVDNDYFDDV